MKFIHLADLHIGKRYQEYSLIENQKDMLAQILNYIDANNIDAVLIAGDVYDKSVPPTEAVTLFDDFLVQLAKRKVHTAIIAGNHDSSERLAFGNRLIALSGIHISSSYNGNIESFTMQDEYGNIEIYLLPFVKPAIVKPFFPEQEITNYTQAAQLALQNVALSNTRKILLAHQFVTGAEKSGSEMETVGGLDNVDAAVFNVFDYVALGHIHQAQQVVRQTIRYSGSPLKYDIKEVNKQKSFTVVEMKEKGSIAIQQIPIVPKQDIVIAEGSFDEITGEAFVQNIGANNFVFARLHSEEDVFDAYHRLCSHYPYLIGLKYMRNTEQLSENMQNMELVENKSPLELFEELFVQMNGTPINEEQRNIMQKAIAQVWEA
ncbi:MAG: exonuclease SbcCD subunit D [Eubacteriales bacterium]|nr:exonuclease SbcCD subunit D [Eubacteriales bacterium]